MIETALRRATGGQAPKCCDDGNVRPADQAGEWRDTGALADYLRWAAYFMLAKKNVNGLTGEMRRPSTLRDRTADKGEQNKTEICASAVPEPRITHC